MTFLTPLPKVWDCSLLCQCLVILLLVSGWLCCWALHFSINKLVPEFLEHTRLKLVYNACVCVVAAGYFVTRIFHPNVAKNGEICVNTLKKDWKPTLGLRHVLLVQSYPLSGLLYFFEIWQNAYYRPFHAVSDFCLRVVCKKYTTCVPFSIFMELFMFGALISVLLWSFIWCLDLCCIASVSLYVLLLWL